MNDEKLCEYLSDVGVLLFDNIDLFFEIHSKNNKDKHFKNERDKLKESLFLYLQKTSKDENLLRHMSKQLIESYYNSRLITKYKTIKNFINILHNKLLLTYINFFIKISKYIRNKNIENKNNINDINKINSDNNIFRNSLEDSNSKKYNKKTKTKIKAHKKPKRIKGTNQYKNNFYINIQDNNINPHSFFVNNNDFYLNMYKKDFDYNNDENTNLNILNDDFNNNISNIISGKYYSPVANIKSKIPINNYISIEHN